MTGILGVFNLPGDSAYAGLGFLLMFFSFQHKNLVPVLFCLYVSSFGATVNVIHAHVYFELLLLLLVIVITIGVYMFLNLTVLFSSLVSPGGFYGLPGIVCEFMYSIHRGSFISYFPTVCIFVSLHC